MPMSKNIPAYSPELIAQYESDIGVPDGFFSRIIHEDDWSFVVKLHGMIEAGLTQILLSHFGDERLEIPFAKMNIGGSSGKLALTRALELLPPANLNFIVKLTEMRNSLVHKISNVAFSIENYIQSLDNQQLKNLIAACGDGIIPEMAQLRQPYEEQQAVTFLKRPRELFWWSGVLVLGNLAKSKRSSTLKRKIEETERQAGQIILNRD